MKRFEWVDAKSAQEAVKLTDSSAADLMGGKNTSAGSVIKAGGIDLLDLLKERVLPATRLVNVRTIASLHKVSVDGESGDVTIGPLMTLSELAQHKTIQERYTALSDAAAHIATPNIRNAATIGGNLLQRPRCWYFRSSEFNCLKKGGNTCPAIHGENKYHAVFDNEICPIAHPSTTAVALVALGASLELTSKQGVREVVLEEFFVGPDKDVLRENVLSSGELISAIRLPNKSCKSAHIKMGEKDSFDWSTGDCAVAIQVKDITISSASIILGAAAPTPWRAKQAEDFLVGKTMSESTAHEAAKLALAKAKPLSQNEYKVAMLEVAIKRALLKTSGLNR
ncbi:MAG: FAD binding domain-containing protein [Candidatus Obscuribacterales bacterium]|nr:FAD binding domain-containing protein [Candidatus Obscuribacterales bacterium]